MSATASLYTDASNDATSPVARRSLYGCACTLVLHDSHGSRWTKRQDRIYDLVHRSHSTAHTQLGGRLHSKMLQPAPCGWVTLHTSVRSMHASPHAHTTSSTSTMPIQMKSEVRMCMLHLKHVAPHAPARQSRGCGVQWHVAAGWLGQARL